jgi:hypothetical protein
LYTDYKIDSIEEKKLPIIAALADKIIPRIKEELSHDLVPETIFDKGREPFLDDGTLAARDKHYRKRLNNMIAAIETIQAYQAELDAQNLTQAKTKTPSG